MNDVTTLLHRALEGEPALGLDADRLVTDARRSARRRRTAVAVSGTAVATVSALALSLTGWSSQPVVVTPAAQPTVPAEVDEDNLAQTVADQLGITWREVRVHGDARRPGPVSKGLSLYGAVDDAAGDSMVSVNALYPVDGEPRTKRGTPSCADGSSFGNEGAAPAPESYSGPCFDRTLENGAVLVVRDERSGAYARVSAMLFRLDGSSLLAESTNQDWVDVSLCTEDASGKHCPTAPITRVAAGVTPQALADLLVALEPATR